jgi:hypothetical protein
MKLVVQFAIVSLSLAACAAPETSDFEGTTAQPDSRSRCEWYGQCEVVACQQASCLGDGEGGECLYNPEPDGTFCDGGVCSSGACVPLVPLYGACTQTSDCAPSTEWCMTAVCALPYGEEPGYCAPHFYEGTTCGGTGTCHDTACMCPSGSSVPLGTNC